MQSIGAVTAQVSWKLHLTALSAKAAIKPNMNKIYMMEKPIHWKVGM